MPFSVAIPRAKRVGRHGGGVLGLAAALGPAAARPSSAPRFTGARDGDFTPPPGRGPRSTSFTAAAASSSTRFRARGGILNRSGRTMRRQRSDRSGSPGTSGGAGLAAPLGGGEVVVTPPGGEGDVDATRSVRLAGTIPPELWNRLGMKVIPKLRSTGADLQATIDLQVRVGTAQAEPLRPSGPSCSASSRSWASPTGCASNEKGEPPRE